MSSIYYADQKAIDLDRCPVVYSRPFSEASLREDFEAASGSWSVTEDGWLTGLHRDNSGGMLYTRQSWPFDTLVEFDARAVPPCCNDLNFVLKTCGWDAEKGDAGRGYIAGLGGWWLNKAGIRRTFPTAAKWASAPTLPTFSTGISWSIRRRIPSGS